MTANWILKRENTIYNTVSTRVTKKYATKYPDMRFTMDGEPDDTSTAFPTVYIKYLPVIEQGKTLDNKEINAIEMNVQVEINTSKTQGQYACRELAYELVEQFKMLMFNITFTPEIITTGDDTHRVVFRAGRMLGQGDTIK